MTEVHPTALVDPRAELAEDVAIGPYCVVGPEVRLDAGVVLHSHVVVEGRTHLGAGVQVYAFAAVGTRPQDLKFADEPSRLEVGANTIIREHCTLNPGTRGDRMETTVGADCVLMVGTHIAHDCVVADNVVMANQATLAGHVHVAENAFLGGLCAIHQFSRIGKGAMIGGMSGVENDVIPYGLVVGNRARLTGLNLVGLRRRGVPKAEVQKLRAAYQTLFLDREGTFQERLERAAREHAGVGVVDDLLAFIRTDSSRALCQPQDGNGA